VPRCRVYFCAWERPVARSAVHCDGGRHRLRRLHDAAARPPEFFILQAKNAPMAHPRPLSPHLSIYRPMLTMMMSIVHRITGVGLYFGMLLLAWWFMAVASGPNAYANLQWAMNSWFGRLISLGFTWALLHHALGGIRHLIWDVGYGFEHNEREWMARASLIGSILLTVLLWVAGYLVVGRS
jgi:succinate dehydrogenase / fumarate reductase cytochrome b subunit